MQIDTTKNGYKHYFVGQVRDVRQDEKRNNKGETYYQNHMYIEGDNFLVLPVRLTKDQNEKGWFDELKKFVGRRVCIPINQMHRSFKDQVYSTVYVAGMPVEVK